MGFFGGKTTSRSSIDLKNVVKAKATSLHALENFNEDEWLESVYSRIVDYCDKENLQPPNKGIIDKTKMHICEFNVEDGFKNGNFYQLLGTKACMPCKEGDDWREAVKKAFKFPLFINGNSKGGSFGAVILPHFINEDKFLILKEWRLPIGGYAYNFPRGFADKCEKQIETAMRELAEETGITASIKDAVSLGPLYENNGISYNIANIYYLPIRSKVEIKTEDGSSWALESGEGIMNGINAGCHVESATNGTVEGIIDSFTLSAFMKYLAWKPQNN